MSLTITRKPNEKIVLYNSQTGDVIKVRVDKVTPNKAQISIEAPGHYLISRTGADFKDEDIPKDPRLGQGPVQ